MLIFRKKIYYKDWIHTWLLNQKKFVKESTYASYSNMIFNHISPCLGNYTLDKLNHTVLQEFLVDKFYNGRIDGKGGLSEKTIKDMSTILKSSLKVAMNQNIIKQQDLTFNYPKSSHKSKIYILSKSEQKKINEYILNNMSNRNIGILLTLYSGIRIGELCALKWSDINFEKGCVSISKTLQRIYIKSKENGISKIVITPPKTKNANRDIPLNKEFMIMLYKLKTNDEDYILSSSNKCVEPRTYRKYFNSVLNKMNINKINFHALRHTFATNCIRLGVDYKTVSELLGHSNVNITFNLYVHPEMSEKKKCINLIYNELQKK